MSRRSRRNRMIDRTALQNPESGAPIATPEDDVDELEQREDLGEEDDDEAAVVTEPRTPAAAPASSSTAKGSKAERLDRARELPPDRSHWTSAWENGRYAAMAAFQRGVPLVEISKIAPPSDDRVGCRDCWTRGRDAVVEVLTDR